MNFTDGEMVFMNSITNGDKLYGLRFQTPGIINESNYINETLQELRKKDILCSDDKLSEEGIIYTYLFEKFKSAKSRLIINSMHVALIDKSDNAICIIRNDTSGNEMVLVKCYDILIKLIKDCSYLREKTEEYNIAEKSIETSQWFENMKNNQFDIINITVMNNEKTKCDRVFYYDKIKGYEYDKLTKIERIATPQYIRMFLMEELGIHYEKKWEEN